MANVRTVAWSSVGKKYASGITGLALVLFLVGHLVGNLLIYVGPEAFNHYAYFLEHLGHGALLYVVEAGLVAFFVLHIAAGISVALGKRAARIDPYYQVADAGGPSHKSLASRTMILTGIAIFVFVVLHVKMFKYGPAEHVVLPGGEEARDVYTLVVLAFKSPVIALGYTAVMVLIGLHLRHGIWSAFQSIGVSHLRVTPALYLGGIVAGTLLAFGFLLFPVIILLFYENPAAGGGG